MIVWEEETEGDFLKPLETDDSDVLDIFEKLKKKIKYFYQKKTKWKAGPSKILPRTFFCAVFFTAFYLASIFYQKYIF